MRLSNNEKILFFIFLLFPLSSCTPYSLKHPEHPQSSLEGEKLLYQEEGWASWYGPGFYGRKTASGERYRKNGFTCAHRTLPFGTRLEVTHLKSGKTVQVRVNDRGPMIRSRVIDLSYAAAKQIGMLKSGETKVAIRELKSLEELFSSKVKKR